MIEYRVNTSSEIDIFNHLNKCSDSFVPELSTYVDIEKYSKKIYDNATRFEAYSDNELIGLIALYTNTDMTSFITNVSVIPLFQGTEVASKIFDNCKYHAVVNEYSVIKLEVKIDNNRAIKFYKNRGFIITNTNNNHTMELQLRNYNKELSDTNDHKYAYNFDFDVMHPYMIKSFKPFFKGGDVLELGSSKGDFTRRLFPYFKDITCVEASSEAVGIMKSYLQQDFIKEFGDNIAIYNFTFEETKLPRKYNNIILTHVLEHIDDPVGLLKKINDEWLTDDGNLFITCPNANAPSRQIAVKMDLISHNSAITPSEKEHGHRITYTLDTLERDAKLSGLNVIHRSGIFFKALANFQWDRLLETDIISKEYLDGCYELGQQYPDLCSSIMLVCKKKVKICI
jgi:2-polyprenyl-3-methyl-5-hydroxy-6-metoxy-1,4-benzoquinol methylase